MRREEFLSLVTGTAGLVLLILLVHSQSLDPLRSLPVGIRDLLALLLSWSATAFLPVLPISYIGSKVKGRADEVNGESVGSDELGRELRAGWLIGVLERSLIFILVYLAGIGMIELRDSFSALSVIVAAKAIFRFGEGEGARVRADWYIIGTFASLIAGVALSLITLWLAGGWEG